MQSNTAANAPTAQGDKNGEQPSNSQPTQEEILQGNDINALRRMAYGHSEPFKLNGDGKVISGMPADIEDDYKADVDLTNDADTDFHPYSDDPFGKNDKPEPVAEVTEEKSEETEAKSEEDETESETEEIEEEDGKTPKRERIRLNLEKLPEQDKAIVKLMGKRQISYAQAYQEITGQKLGSVQAEVEQKSEETPTKPASVLAVEQQEAVIAELQKRRTTASENFDAPASDKISIEIERELRKLAKLEAKVDREQEVAESETINGHQREVDASTDRALALYPDLVKEGTPLFNAVEADFVRLKKVNPSFFQDVEWPETLAAKWAARLRVAPANSEPAPPKAPVTPKKAVSRTVPPEPSNAKGAAVQSTGMTEQQFQAWVNHPNTSAAEIREALKHRATGAMSTQNFKNAAVGVTTAEK